MKRRMDGRGGLYDSSTRHYTVRSNESDRRHQGNLVLWTRIRATWQLDETAARRRASRILDSIALNLDHSSSEAAERSGYPAHVLARATSQSLCTNQIPTRMPRSKKRLHDKREGHLNSPRSQMHGRSGWSTKSANGGDTFRQRETALSSPRSCLARPARHLPAASRLRDA